MPRQYTPDPRSKRHVWHPPCEIIEALNLIRKGNSIRSVAKSQKIPYSVLQRYSKKSQANPNIEIRKYGGQTTLPAVVEQSLVANIIKCADWGYPVTELEIRMFVKYHLDQIGCTIKHFKNNRPGVDWAKSFLKRHKDKIAQRMCQNIKRNRAAVSHNQINEYFDNISKVIEGVPPSNIINYDETNLSDDPGRKKVICKRGTKYPERVMNQTKSATSLMFAASADGTLLPPYVIYKSAHLYDTWTEGGPPGTRYNRTPSGWIDGHCFLEWYTKIIIPHCRRLDGKKVIIGDNLSSHLSPEVIKLSEKHSIEFIFLPPNSTHITQPLDVAFFRPLKGAWRLVLENWKTSTIRGKKAATINKDCFPSLLKATLNKLLNKNGENIKAGFEKTGLYPLNRKKVIDMLPQETEDEDSMISNSNLVSENLTNFLKESRYGTAEIEIKQRKKRLKVPAGKSIKEKDLTISESEDDPEEINNNEEDIEMTGNEADEEQIINELLDREDIEYIEESTKNEKSIEKELQNSLNDHCGRSSNNNNVGKMPDNVLKDNLKKGSWAVVNFGKKIPELYFGKIISVINSGKTYRGIFTRPSTSFKGKNIYCFPDIVDESIFELKQVIRIVQEPTFLRRGRLQFHDDLKNIQDTLFSCIN